MNKTRVSSFVGLSLASLIHAPLLMADSPSGWIQSSNPSAYTIAALDFELSLGAFAVNDDIDFLDIREDLLAGTRKLGGDSGDLSGQRAELHVGLTSYLSAFYRRHTHDLKIDLGPVASINLLDIDDRLSTTATAYGLKWTFFEERHTDNTQPWRTASLELTRTSNSSDNFEGIIDSVTLSGGLNVSFITPQTFRLQDMEDDGWQARLLYSMPLGNNFASTLWAGYAKNEASSGTGSSIVSTSSLAPAFQQSFTTQETQLLVGASLNWQITQRMPLQLSYEYVRLTDTKLTAITNPNNSLLPSFLRGNNLNTDAKDNHTLRGSLSYWLTPSVHASLVGNLFSNQFLGVIPHYNNPLSGSFSDKPYGYLGLQIGVAL